MPGKTEGHRILHAHRQFQLRGKTFRKDKTCPRVRQIPERTCQISSEAGTESTRQTGARQTQQVGDHTRTKARETGLVLRREIKPGQRQPAEALRQLISVETRLLIAGKRQPLCRKRCRCQSCLRGKALFAAAGNDALEQERGTAEEAQRPSHLEQQRLWWQNADFRREPAGPAGEPVQGRTLTSGVPLPNGQDGQKRPRLGHS